MFFCRSSEERDVGEHGDPTHASRPDAGATLQRYHGDRGRRAAEQRDDGGSDRYREKKKKTGSDEGHKSDVLNLSFYSSRRRLQPHRRPQRQHRLLVVMATARRRPGRARRHRLDQWDEFLGGHASSGRHRDRC